MKKFTDLSLENYLHELAGDAPVPGGGSASAYVASLAMGLSQMVCRITLKRKPKKELSQQEQQKDASRREQIEGLLNSLEKARRDAFQIVNQDPEVYQEVMAAYKIPEKLGKALQDSFRLQADLAFLIIMAHEWNTALMELVSGSIKNDLRVSAGLLQGAFYGAYHTAKINMVYMKDEKQRQDAEKALEELKTRFEKGISHAAEASQAS